MSDSALNSRIQQVWLTVSTTPKLLQLVWNACPTWLLLSLGCTVLNSLLPVAWLYTNKLIIDALASSIQEQLVSWQNLTLLVGIRFGLALIKQAISEMQPYIAQVLGDRFSLYTSQKLLEQSIQLDLAHYESSQFHEALSRAQQSGSSYPVRAFNNFTTILGQSISLLSVLGLLIYFNPLIVGLLVLTSLPPLRVGIAFSNKGFAAMRKQTLSNRLASYFQGLLTQQQVAKEVRLYNLGDYLLNRWMDIRLEIQSEIQDLTWKRAVSRFRVSILPNLGFYGAYVWVIVQTVRSRITIGDFTMYSGAFSQAQGLLSSLVENISVAYESNLYVSQYLEFLALTPSIQSPPNPQPFPEVIQHGIQLSGVTFSYPGSSEPTLIDITLSIEPGESIALVGVNGVGKTTLVKLLTRLYDPTYGEITVDGIPLQQFDLLNLRQNIAVLFQDFTHYKLSIAENIGLGNVDLINDMNQIQRAAQAAGIDEWIRSLPHGYETKLGNLFPKGRELSGGQWQKVGLARVFMSTAPILILDEPTAAMDAIAEAELFERFRQLTTGRTTLFTSHRFSSVRLADRILVLEKGRIHELGSHDQLMAQDGLYAKMFRLQAEGYQM